MAFAAAKRARRDERYTQTIALRAQLGFVSSRALSAVLTAAKRESLPDAHRREDIREARDNYVKASTPYGPVHQTVYIDERTTIEIQHPFAMLYKVCQTSQRFSDLMAWAASMSPPSCVSPWGIIMYADEVNPGNQLAYQHSRKSWCVYWTFEQFENFTSDEEVWFEVTVVRSSRVNLIAGGMSTVMKHLLLQAFFNKDNHHFALSGARFVLHDATELIVFAKLSQVLADADALHLIFGCKSASGLKLCPLCLNVFNGNTVRDISMFPGAVFHYCSDSRKFALATPALYDSIVKRLNAQKTILGKTAFDEL